jgi:hypothetical protein
MFARPRRPPILTPDFIECAKVPARPASRTRLFGRHLINIPAGRFPRMPAMLEYPAKKTHRFEGSLFAGRQSGTTGICQMKVALPLDHLGGHQT